MSEEKIYVVKNDAGEFLDGASGIFDWFSPSGEAFSSKKLAESMARDYNGHVVTLVEEPKKVVLNEEQAKIVENARDEEYPATYIYNNYVIGDGNEEELLMEAYVNGYTVAKKKYRVLLPESWCRSEDKQKYFLFDTHIGISWTEDRNDPKTMFTKEQLGTLGLDRAYFRKDEVMDTHPYKQ